MSNSSAFSEMSKEVLLTTSGMWTEDKTKTKVRFISFCLIFGSPNRDTDFIAFFDNDDLFRNLWPEYAKCTVYKTEWMKFIDSGR